eukprot:GDKJ01032642.1.p1 GENE.GDKJ01032642.1~~GDKJ01032642.1.p1  ORF type:complete len:164 (+),score=17.62 GDKJ01032642.1:26-517(+)
MESDFRPSLVILDPGQELNNFIRRVRSMIRTLDSTEHVTKQVAKLKLAQEPIPADLVEKVETRCSRVSDDCRPLFYEVRDGIKKFCTEDLMDQASRCTFLISLSEDLVHRCRDVELGCVRLNESNYREQSYKWSPLHMLQKRGEAVELRPVFEGGEPPKHVEK